MGEDGRVTDLVVAARGLAADLLAPEAAAVEAAGAVLQTVRNVEGVFDVERVTA